MESRTNLALAEWTDDDLQQLAAHQLEQRGLIDSVKVQVLPRYTPTNRQAVLRVLRGESVWRNNSPASRRLQRSFTEKVVAADYVLPVASATAGLHTVLSYYWRRGGKTYMSGYTWYSVLAMVLQAGCIPEFLDLSPSLELELGNVPSSAQCVLTSHLFGGTSLTEQQIANLRTNHIPIIEDCAQCVRGQIGSEPIGMVGDVGIFSFNGSKQIPAGEGGIIATNDKNLAEFCENFMLTVNSPLQPAIKRFNSASDGFNYRLPAVSASLAESLIQELDWRLQAAIDVGEKVASAVKEFPFLSLPNWPLSQGGSPLGLPVTLREAKSGKSLAQSRALLFYMFRQAGIPASVWIDETLPETGLYGRFVDWHNLAPPSKFSLPNARRFADSHLVLPTASAMGRSSVLSAIRKVLSIYETL